MSYIYEAKHEPLAKHTNMKIDTRQLRPISDLFHLREQLLNRLINELTINDVRENTAFQASVARIKHQVLLNPVAVQAPTIGTHTSRTRAADPYHNPGGRETVLTFPVSFPVTGSSEILRYRVSDKELDSAELYVPAISNGNSISVSIENQALDRAQVLAKASQAMALTETLIGQNNPEVEAWSARISTEINNAAAKKRQELVAFYS